MLIGGFIVVIQPAATTTTMKAASTSISSAFGSISTSISMLAPPPSPMTIASSTIESIYAALPSSSANPVASPSPSGSSSSGSGSGSSAGGNGGLWAMTYSPYGGDGKGQTWCKKEGEIESDIERIASKGFKTVRIYATDCGQLEIVDKACKAHGMKMILGVFFNRGAKADPEADFAEQIKDITSHFSGNYENIEVVTIGNECIREGGPCTGDSLSNFIKSARSILRNDGYSGMISSALTVAEWQDNPQLCSAVDVVAGQIHAFFSNQPVSPSDAGDYVSSQMEILERLCPNKQVLCTESGWPTQGPDYNHQQASPSNQQEAIKSIKNSNVVDKIAFFANLDDLWKAGADVPTYELHFGCLDNF